VTIPSGTAISVTLDTAIASDTSHAEDRIRAHVSHAIAVGSSMAVPQGAELTGTVIEATRSAKVKGLASVIFHFDRLIVDDEVYPLHAQRITRQAETTKGKDAKKIGIGTGVGAVIGGVAGGGKGAAIGAAVGGGAGTGAVLATRGKEVSLPAGTAVRVTLAEPLSVKVPTR